MFVDLVRFALLQVTLAKSIMADFDDDNDVPQQPIAKPVAPPATAAAAATKVKKESAPSDR